jgi:hypothetical protein
MIIYFLEYIQIDMGSEIYSSMMTVFDHTRHVFQVYKGRQYVRGVNTDHWSTCLIWDKLNATFTLDYFFTSKFKFYVHI